MSSSSSSSSHHHQPHLRLAVPPRLSFPPSSSPFPTPSKSKRRPSASSSSTPQSLLLLLLSLRSLYSLLPFLRSSPASFSLFPFTFLVSLLSLLATALLPPSALTLPPTSLLRPLLLKSLLLALVFLLRFQALRSCGTAATILADFSGGLAARTFSTPALPRPRRLLGFAPLLAAFLLLARGWDRAGCSPLAPSAPGDCHHLVAMLLPFLSGFLGFFERSGGHWAPLRQLGRRKVRILSLTLTTAMLLPPAAASLLWGSHDGEKVSVLGLRWPLVNTVLFGVVLGDNNGDERSIGSGKDLQKEFAVTFLCTFVLELFYFPQLSLPGFLACGLLIWIAVRQLACYSSYIELGTDEESESLFSMVRNPVRHILSERKSRKIAVFLLINTAYMVVEFVAGFMSNSLGLISDACHMLFDCAALAIGLYASYISRLPANAQFNYGRGRVEVLSGYVNAVFLVLVGALIVLESFERILDPQDISTSSLLTVSVGGLLVNVIGLVFFHEEHHHAHGGSGCSHSLAHAHAHVHTHSHGHCHHGHSHGHHDQSHGTVIHEHISVTKHNVDSIVEGARDHLHGHTCKDHHNQNHCETHKVVLKEVEVSMKDGCCHGHGGDHHYHGSVNHKTSINSKCEHQSNERSLDSLLFPGQKVHAHEKVHDDKGCCDHHDSMHCPVAATANVHSGSSESTELLSERKVQGKHHHIDHNMEGIFLHVLADTLGSVGVVISTLLIKYKGWLVADPACSIFISIMIVSSVLPLLRNSAEILMQRISRTHEQDLKVALEEVMKIKGVYSIQNVHVWNFTNTEIVGTLDLQISAEADTAFVRKHVSDILYDIGVRDLTVQMEHVKGQ